MPVRFPPEQLSAMLRNYCPDSPEYALGQEHPDVATVLENMAKCYREMGKKAEAEKLEARAKKIRNKQ